MQAVRILLVGALALVTSAQAFAVSGDDFEFHGYLRAGSRANNGPYPGCPKNLAPASGINEFRLGNECEDYSELTFVAHHLKAKSASDPFFRTQITTAFAVPAFTQGETMNPAIAEAFIDGGNLNGTQIKHWIGKRFYRDAAAHINDDFYFANVSGNGFGVYDMKLPPSGHLAFAYFLEQTVTPVTGAQPAARTKGHFFDLRWFDIDVSESQKFDFWALYGINEGGSIPSATVGGATTELDKTHGYAVGLKHKYLLKDGMNALSIQYGKGLVSALTLANLIDVPGASVIKDSNRLRVVENVVMQPMENLGLELAARWEKFENYGATPAGKWWDAGVRPIYSFTQHFGVAVEAGVSSVKYDTATDASLLKRVTIAPEFRVDPKYFARPVFRAFVTTSFERGWAYGTQGEVWF